MPPRGRGEGRDRMVESASRAASRRTSTPQRTQQKKSRTGCLACRAKRRKCDETKPECLMCTRQGRQCSGYQRALKWSMKYQLNPDTDPSGPSNLITLVSATLQSISKEKDASPPANSPPRLEPIVETSDVAGTPQEQTLPPIQLDLENNHILTDLSLPPFDTDIASALENEISGALYDSRVFDLDEIHLDRFTCDEDQQIEIAPAINLDAFTDFPDTPNNASESENDENDENNASRESTETNEPITDLVFSSNPELVQSVVDIPSLLIEYWFKSVCPMWSAFDSSTNPNRWLASAVWTHSKTVFYSLQSMAAVCLVDQLPHLKETYISASKQAIEAIHFDLCELRQKSDLEIRLPTELIWSLFCMGTTMCWSDPRQLGLPFLRETRKLLAAVNRRSSWLSAEDRQVLYFFNKSFIYWDMLCRVVSTEEADDDLTVQSNAVIKGPHQLVPHPWTGVSTDIQDLFAKAMGLCRTSRTQRRAEGNMTAKALQQALRDIEEARRIEEALLAIELPILTNIADTGDELCPRSHLVDVAEAYRLASLLQLYQTFPDLSASRLPQAATESGVVPHSQWLSPLALQLIKVLERVPPNSGTRCIQPLLYLSAGSGLKFDTPISSNDGPPKPLAKILGSGFGDSNEILFSSMLLSTAHTPNGHGPTITQTTLEISRARRFILERLSLFEHSLPSKPIVVATQLIKEVWSAFDREEPSSNNIHWMDVMMDTGLQTIFG